MIDIILGQSMWLDYFNPEIYKWYSRSTDETNANTRTLLLKYYLTSKGKTALLFFFPGSKPRISEISIKKNCYHRNSY